MAEPGTLDRVYHYALQTMVERGYAPHYTEIARAFGVAPEGGKQLLHDLMATGIPAWLHPSIDLIASIAPFNNLPTHYRIGVEGRALWFGQ